MAPALFNQRRFVRRRSWLCFSSLSCLCALCLGRGEYYFFFSRAHLGSLNQRNNLPVDGAVSRKQPSPPSRLRANQAARHGAGVASNHSTFLAAVWLRLWRAILNKTGAGQQCDAAAAAVVGGEAHLHSRQIGALFFLSADHDLANAWREIGHQIFRPFRRQKRLSKVSRAAAARRERRSAGRIINFCPPLAEL